MSVLNRGLDDDFVEALNREYERGGSWWKGFVDDKELFLAIRRNYVNVYYRGCSLLKLKWNGAILGETHYKYLLRPKLTNGHGAYLDVRDGRVDFPVKKVGDFFVEDLIGINDLKQAAKPYAETEKIGVHEIVSRNWNVLDVEIAFGESANLSAPRADFAVLRKTEKGENIVFFEAKHFGKSKGALRAEGDAEPKVIGQIGRYADLLRRNRKTIIDSYRRVCCNLWNMSGVNERNPERHKLLHGIVDGSIQLHVDEEPELVVFGFDADQRDGKNWGAHREKLKSQLGSRVHFVGDSKNFRCKAN